MATKYWLGTAAAVAQVTTTQITAFDGATTYTVTIGNQSISVVGDTDEDTTAANLQAALAASTHPYFTAITWTVVTDTITGTAAIAGVPFTFTTSDTGGSGTISAPSTTTASSGPADWGTADNWSDGVVPVSTDTVIFKDNSNNVAYGLDQNAVTLTELIFEQTYTGLVGLDYRSFATAVDGGTPDSTVTEYRDVYLQISATDLRVGDTNGPILQSGSPRLMIDLGSVVSTINIVNTSRSSADAGRSAVRLLLTNASNTIIVRSAPGGLGIANEVPGETSTISSIIVSDTTSNSRINIGEGTTITTYEQNGGDNQLNAAANITQVTVDGGNLAMEGSFKATDLDIKNGNVFMNNRDGSDVGADTVTMTGGTLDTIRNGADLTITTLNQNVGSTFRGDPKVATVTNWNIPTDKLFSATITAV